METVYARVEHGGHRVTPLVGDSSGYKVEWPGGPRVYPSARQTIIALVNQDPSPPIDAYDPHLTFDRYFRRGGYQKYPEPNVDVFDLFRPTPGIAIAEPDTQLRPSSALTVYQPPQKGFDVNARAVEVRKLFYAGFARRVLRMGYDPEEVLQEVYLGLMVRNEGKCPFDPAKSSFGHYVHMVCGCIVSNYHRRYARLARNEVFGVANFDDETVDVAEADLVKVEAAQEDESVLASTMRVLTNLVETAAQEAGFDARLAVRCLTYLSEGRRNKEIIEATGSNPTMISKMIKLIREVTQTWRSDLEFA